MKRITAWLTVAALALIVSTAQAQLYGASELHLDAKQVKWVTNAGSYGGESDSGYFSPITTGSGAFGADTSQTILLRNVIPFGGGANADTFFYFRANFYAGDADFASGDTLYVQMDYSNNGTVWQPEGEIRPLLRAGAGAGTTARVMQVNYCVNRVQGSSYLNMLGVYAIRFRVQHDSTNTTANKVRFIFTGFTNAASVF